jgi:superfamily II DNA or RNA helicase
MKNESVLVIVRNIEHGENLYAQLKYLGDTVRWVNGENNTKELQKVLKDLNDGTCRICIASGIFNEGIDVTGLNVCINTTACDSPVTAMQILGRTLRRTSTKSKVDFYDIYDTGVRWLGEHAVNREAMYNTEEEFVITHEDENTYLQK